MMKTIKSLMIVCLLCCGSASAAGIPVVDTAAIAQQKADAIAELAKLAEQLLEAKKQLEQMKEHYKSITGSKGFYELLKNINQITQSGLKDMSDGKVEPNGQTAKEYAVKVTDEIQKRLDKVSELSEKIGQTQDLKGIAELQAQIALETNTINLMSQQIAAFERAEKAQREVQHEEARQRIIKHTYDAYREDNKNSSSSSGSKENKTLYELLF